MGRSVTHLNLRRCELLAAVVAAVIASSFAYEICAEAADSRPASAINLAGEPVDPLQASGGKIAVLIFVRTDCPISNRYAPAIQKLSSQYAAKSTFWLVYPAKSESPASIRQHLQQYGYRLSALQDPQHALVKLSHVEVTPEAAVFNVTGELVYHGRIDNWYQDFGHSRQAPTTHDLADAISAAMNGKRPAVTSTPAVGCYISDLQ
ncbi:MAG TPA: redoxin domain-containing protein [Terriglobales bacterium]|nr:redoxin domain-containing protein [Terriglobales bacterium]